MQEDAYQSAVQQIAQICAATQTPGQLCTVISPNYTDHQKRKVTNMTEYVRDCWRSAGYALYLEAYASRRIQQSQNLAIAKLNNLAKERRLPLTDMTLIMTFQRKDV